MITAHILFIGHLWPEPDSSAAGYRTMALIDACLEQHWNVDFSCAAEPTPWSVHLQKIGVGCHAITINSESFDQWIKELQADFIVFDRFMTEEQFSWRVEKNCPQAIRIIDTSDLHFLRRSRQQQLKLQNQASNNKSLSHSALELPPLDLNNQDSIREISSIYRCDLALVISSYEMKLLIDKFQISKQLLMYLPFMFENSQIKEAPIKNSYASRKNFFMIGNFLHEPNWDAVLWCKQKLWSKIRAAIPEAQLHIYGAYTPEKARQLHQPKEGFFIMGRAENLDALIQKYRVNLVPLRFGAGIKGKIADGFRLGLPCITTSIGAEGMADNLPWGGFICDDENNFCNTAVKLYQQPDTWLQKQQYGYDIIKKIHNKSLHQANFIKQLLQLKKNITQHRNKNFIGSMLRYHLHRSHEFMSRWIEEKNK
ncbi:MAG: glycosyltransferase family 4 protein [Pseudomonadota bacterium]